MTMFAFQSLPCSVSYRQFLLISLCDIQFETRRQCLPLCHTQHHTRRQWTNAVSYSTSTKMAVFACFLLCVVLNIIQDGRLCFSLLVHPKSAANYIGLNTYFQPFQMYMVHTLLCFFLLFFLGGFILSSRPPPLLSNPTTHNHDHRSSAPIRAGFLPDINFSGGPMSSGLISKNRMVHIHVCLYIIMFWLFVIVWVCFVSVFGSSSSPLCRVQFSRFVGQFIWVAINL